MSSVLHPVGPEPEQTYWARRVAVVISLVVVVGVVAALVSSVIGTGSAVSAAPAPPAVTPVSATSPTPSPSASASPTPSASPSTTAGSASPSPSSAAKTKAKTEASGTKKASRRATATGSVACAPTKLRTTLTGKQTLKPKQGNKFTLSLINGSDTTCTVSVTPKNFELKIFSGTDRIWSSNDCSTAVKPISRKVKAEDAVEWTMTWDGKRSRKDCKDRPEVPKAGTYFATAQLDGAKPVQLRMILRG